MPIISAFFGIVIRMYYKEHEPAHFHAEHGSQQAKFDFEGELIAGEISSRRALRQVRAWAQLHRAELDANCENEGRTAFRGHRTADRETAMTFLRVSSKPTTGAAFEFAWCSTPALKTRSTLLSGSTARSSSRFARRTFLPATSSMGHGRLAEWRRHRARDALCGAGSTAA